MEFQSDPIAEFETHLVKRKLEGYSEALKKCVLLAVAFSPRHVSDAEISIGSSKLGGEPDVPPNFAWPLHKHEPLSFVAQLNLHELPAIDTEALPKNGLLSFFYNNQVWGYDPKDKDGFRVFYFLEKSHELRRQAPPVVPSEKKWFGLVDRNLKARTYKSCKLEPRRIATLPGDFDETGLPEVLMDDYYELLEDMGGHHRLLGHAEPIQGEMQIECELVTNGISCGQPSKQLNKAAEESKAAARQWRLLLQIDSETEQSDMMWGDAGRLYFWIKDDDLLHGRFEKCWLISQCY